MQVDTNYQGSRDEMRARLKAAQVTLTACAQEIAVLRSNFKNAEYRQTDAYVGIAICNLELALVAMRKRKLPVETPKEEVPTAASTKELALA